MDAALLIRYGGLVALSVGLALVVLRARPATAIPSENRIDRRMSAGGQVASQAWACNDASQRLSPRRSVGTHAPPGRPGVGLGPVGGVHRGHERTPGPFVLPEGILLDGATVVSQNETSILFQWTGALSAGTQAPLLTFPGTTPLAISARLRASADVPVNFAVVDEYGRAVCSDSIGVTIRATVRDVELACTTGEIAALGWTRLWHVSVGQGAPGTDTAAFEVDVEVTRGNGTIAAAVEPAGLDRIEPFEVLADDGVPLRGHVYLPHGPGPFAVILNFSPYWNGNAETRTPALSLDAGDRETLRSTKQGTFGKFIDAGFAVALVNMRGTGDSGGCHTWFDPIRDGQDAATVIEALADKEWSSESVGMVGISWHGYSQYAALSADPPALKAIAPSSAILDPWLLFTRYGASIPLAGGPFDFGQGTFFHAMQTVDNGGYLAPLQGSPSAPQDLTAEHLRCPQYADQIAATQQLSVTGDDAPFWEARRTGAFIAEADIPMLVTNGLLSHGEGHILQLEGLWPLLPPRSIIVAGQWNHEYPETGGFDEYQRLVLDWFDHHLRGNGGAPAAGVRYQDTSLAWHESASWPPTATSASLFLSGDKLIESEATAESSRRTFTTADDVTPRADQCDSWVTFATPPLAEDVELAGELVANLTLSSTMVDGNLALFVYVADDVAPCGQDAGAAYVTRALSDLRHRGNLRQGKDFLLNVAESVNIRSHPFAATIPAGSRLIVVLGGDAPGELADKPMLPDISVHTGSTAGSSIHLPVVQGELRFKN